MKETIKAFRSSRLILFRAVYYVARTFGQIIRMAGDRDYRHARFTKWRQGKNAYQQSGFTVVDRYPRIFEAVARHFAGSEAVRLLSFGCATGEEVFTLGRYLPQADVTGVDINDWRISQCAVRYPDPRFHFYPRFSESFLRSGDFDAICCMAVFQDARNRLEPGAVATSGFTFAQFEADVLMLHSKLKPGGLFIIDNADFSFLDTACAVQYRVLDFPANQISRNRPLFGRNNQKVADVQQLFRVFVKAV